MSTNQTQHRNKLSFSVELWHTCFEIHIESFATSNIKEQSKVIFEDL